MSKRIGVFLTFFAVVFLCGFLIDLYAQGADSPAGAPADEPRTLLIRKDDLSSAHVYTQAKPTLFDSPQYRFENYFWKTPLGDSIWLDLKYAGEIIDVFDGQATWKGIEDSQIIFALSWFFNSIKRQIKNVETLPVKTILEELTDEGVHRETYRLGPFSLDWKMRVAAGNEKLSVTYFTQLREEFNRLLIARKLQETTYSLVNRKVIDEKRRVQIKQALDESFERDDLFSFGPTGKSSRSLRARLARLDWQMVAFLLTIVGIIVGFYVGFRHFFKKQ
jgi:hypothetical protein